LLLARFEPTNIGPMASTINTRPLRMTTCTVMHIFINFHWNCF
jgi:hypothetical protein